MLQRNYVWALLGAFFVAALVSLWMAGCGTPPKPEVSAAPSPVPPAPATPPYKPLVRNAPEDVETALKKFKVAPGLEVNLWAAEPLLANPVAMVSDERGRWYVAETFRYTDGVLDIRGRMDWLDEELASRSVGERVELMQRRLKPDKIKAYTVESDRVKRIEDTDGDGRADHATVFADGFNRLEDGILAGVLARQGQVYVANIPNLWLLSDTNDDGVAENRRSLQHGYGVRVGFIGHDLHGLRFGPDGKLYFSVGDRGFNVTQGKRSIASPESGAVLRCNPDGSELEIVHRGLRNPQELAFDQYGNLFTGDNNSDGGDQARWVQVVEGGDSGWHIGWQFITWPNARGPWMAEKMDKPLHDPALQPAHIVPPLLNIGSGPSGLAYDPGTGLLPEYRNHFFLCDFRGSSSASGVHTFTLEPAGATFRVAQLRPILWSILCTDADVGVDGGLYISDWVEGWEKPGRGRIYRVHAPGSDADPALLETKTLLREGMGGKSVAVLTALLGHADQRVRQEAQFALAAKGAEAGPALVSVSHTHTNQLARLHAMWGLGQIAGASGNAKNNQRVLTDVLPLLKDPDAEVRAQAAKVLGDHRFGGAQETLVRLTKDEQPRVRYFAALGLGKLGRRESIPVLVDLLRANADRDAYVRHAAVMGLVWIGDASGILSAARDPSPSVRMGALLAMRRLERRELASFLQDQDMRLVQEAARAINDLPIREALPQLAALISKSPGPTTLMRRVLNANFRLGGKTQAEALATLAMSSNVEETLRVEALQHLANWPQPPGRDAVTGLWRPLPPREPGPAIDAVAKHLTPLLNNPAGVQVATIRAVEKLAMKEAIPALLGVVQLDQAESRVRIAALQALSTFNDPALFQALQAAQSGSDRALRNEARRLYAKSNPDQAIVQLEDALKNGTLEDRQATLATVATVPGEKADALVLEWMNRLLAGQVPPALVLDVLEAAEARTAPAVQEKRAAYDATRRPEDPMRTHRECLAGGKAEEGRKIFFERVEVYCSRCHLVQGEGGVAGPDLTGIGARQTREYLLESILYPNQKIAEGFETTVVKLNNGTVYAGILTQENDATLELNSSEDGLTTIRKSDIKSREKGGSGMPAELRQVLTKRDLRHLVEYLSGLKEGVK